MSLPSKGFTFVELMLALALGSLLMLALGSFVAQTRQLTVRLETVDQFLDHQRLSWLMVQREMQMAGFQSCLSQLPASWRSAPLAQGSVLGWEALGTAPGDHWPDAPQPVWSGSHGLALPSRLADQLTAGADVLVLNRAVRIALSEALSVRASGQSLHLRFSQSTGVRQGETVVLADLHCQHVIALRQESTQSQTLTVSSQDMPTELAALLMAQAWSELQLLSWQTQAYYIGSAQDQWALFRRRLDRVGAPAEELIRGVSTQQLLYGEPDAMGTGLVFRPAHQVQHWRRVRALHWGLLWADPLAQSALAEPPTVLGVRGWASTGLSIERNFSLRQGD
jgi:prepilin-type N-terminal cleavage/methylation domain-containing protein